MANVHSSAETPSHPARLRPTDIPHILPHEKVFPIQIGSELFKLSGASISSDGFKPSSCCEHAKKLRAPSYFSSFFRCQLDQHQSNGDQSSNVRTLYIDRDPVTFGDISRHLQGYHISPQDGSHFVKLFADAQFYQLPRLIGQLYEDSMFMSIGGREFQIRRDIFASPGNSPNYFTLGFAFLFSNPGEAFPGLERDGLIRPPSILPPAIPNRSADTFAEILHMLRGYPLHIRNEEHRGELLRDCKYFLFKGLEQRIIPHTISYNFVRQRDEITLRLEDIRQPGVSVVPESESNQTPVNWICYARPYVDDEPYELIVEIVDDRTQINMQTLRATFVGDSKTRITRLLEVVSNKLNLQTTQPLGLLMASGGASSQPASPGNTPLSDDQVKVSLEDAAIMLDGHNWQHEDGVEELESAFRKKRKRQYSAEKLGDWTVKTGQWKFKVQHTNNKTKVECIMVAVKLDCYTTESARNERRLFLRE